MDGWGWGGANCPQMYSISRAGNVPNHLFLVFLPTEPRSTEILTGGSAWGVPGVPGAPRRPHGKSSRVPRGAGSRRVRRRGAAGDTGTGSAAARRGFGMCLGVLLRLWGGGWAAQHTQKVASGSLNRAVSEWAALPCPHQHLFQVYQR